MHADYLSRLEDKYDWQLHPVLFRTLDERWGPHTVDRFADITISQLPVYNSRFKDPQSSAVDALGQRDWAINDNWVCPPFRLFPSVLQVIREQSCDSYRTMGASPTVPPTTSGDVHSQANKTTQDATDNYLPRPPTGTTPQSEMENIRMETIWCNRLKELGWSETSVALFPFSWAPSTLAGYNRAMTSCMTWQEIGRGLSLQSTMLWRHSPTYSRLLACLISPQMWTCTSLPIRHW